MSPLDPQNPTPAISMNRVRLVDLPGLDIDPEVKDRTGYDLLSAATLTGLIRQRIDALRLDPALDDHALRLAFGACFASGDAAVRAAAELVARRMGHNLGYLLLALRRGDAVNWAARAEWDASYWQHWAGIRMVWLGGGLVGGRLGDLMRDHAQAVIAEARIDDLAVRRSPYGRALPLVGAARCAPPGSERALVFDCGGTWIKRACATYDNGTLTALHYLSPLPAAWAAIVQATEDPDRQAIRLFERMVAAIMETRQAADVSPADPVRVALAAYVRDGHPLATQGGAYMQLRRITDDLQGALAARLGAARDAVQLMGDGRAAALAYAGHAHAAVLMIGTALGIGFPPESADRLRAITPGFVMRNG